MTIGSRCRRAGLVVVVAVAVLGLSAAAGAQTRPRHFQPKHEAPDGTVLADREILDCDIKQKPVKNGPPPPSELAARLIRCIFERPPVPRGDGAVTIDIDKLEIGAPRLWTPDRDAGGGNPTTVVYPVRTVWTRKIFQRIDTLIQTQESIFDCHVNLLDKWECAVGSEITTGEMRRIRVR